jgi:hypothetical protein
MLPIRRLEKLSSCSVKAVVSHLAKSLYKTRVVAPNASGWAVRDATFKASLPTVCGGWDSSIKGWNLNWRLLRGSVARLM